jgi:hypothetical protein
MARKGCAFSSPRVYTRNTKWTSGISTSNKSAVWFDVLHHHPIYRWWRIP